MLFKCFRFSDVWYSDHHCILIIKTNLKTFSSKYLGFLFSLNLILNLMYVYSPTVQGVLHGFLTSPYELHSFIDSTVGQWSFDVWHKRLQPHARGRGLQWVSYMSPASLVCNTIESVRLLFVQFNNQIKQVLFFFFFYVATSHGSYIAHI